MNQTTEGAVWARRVDHAAVRTPRIFWPLVPIGASVFLLAALTAFRLRGGPDVEAGIFAAPVIALYRWIGFEPAFMFCLLLLTWSSIWFLTGRIEKPWLRVARIAGLTLCLAILVNLRSDGVVPEHGGAVGGFLATRLDALLGFVASTLLVSLAAVVMLFRATDSFFIRHFEGLTPPAAKPVPPPVDDGVEAQAIDELQSLQFSQSASTGIARGGVRVLGAAEPARAPEPEPAVAVADEVEDDADEFEDEPQSFAAALDADDAEDLDIDFEAELEDELDEEDDDAWTVEAADESEPEPERDEIEESEPVVVEAGPDSDLDEEDELEADDEPVVELPALPPEPPSPSRQGALFGAAAADASLLDEAASLVVESRRASANFLRRRLRISLEEAKDVLAALAERGIVECEPGAGHGRVVGDR